MNFQSERSLAIRTQVSQQFSLCSSDAPFFQHSVDSLNLIDEGVTLHIQHLHRMAQQRAALNNLNHTSRSHSFIHIEEEVDIQYKKKSTSMKARIRSQESMHILNNNQLNQLMAYHKVPNLAKNDLFNRIYGAMFGFLIGDSLGSTLINQTFSPSAISQAMMMKGGGPIKLKAGQGTDQWEICMTLSQALIECGAAYDHNIVAAKYLQWIDSNPFDLPVLMGIAFSDIKKKRRQKKLSQKQLGQMLVKSSLKNTKQQSNLGLIRIIPLVIWGIKLEEYEFNHILKKQLQLITPNTLVLETCLVFCNILRTILTTTDHLQAFRNASQYVQSLGSDQLMDIWRSIQDNKEPTMTNQNANNLKFPFIFAINQMLSIDPQKDMKRQFIQSAVRLLSKGHNTDTNCSVGLGLIGAVVGYNNIPAYYRNKVLNAQYSGGNRVRSREYHPKKIVELVGELIKSAPKQLQEQLF